MRDEELEGKEFTPAQEQAMEKVYDILREHFDASVFAVVTDIEATDGQEVNTIYWHGGRIRALGLAHLATHKLTVRASDDLGEMK